MNVFLTLKIYHFRLLLIYTSEFWMSAADGGTCQNLTLFRLENVDTFHIIYQLDLKGTVVNRADFYNLKI